MLLAIKFVFARSILQSEYLKKEKTVDEDD